MAPPTELNFLRPRVALLDKLSFFFCVDFLEAAGSVRQTGVRQGTHHSAGEVSGKEAIVGACKIAYWRLPVCFTVAGVFYVRFCGSPLRGSARAGGRRKGGVAGINGTPFARPGNLLWLRALRIRHGGTMPARGPANYMLAITCCCTQHRDMPIHSVRWRVGRRSVWCSLCCSLQV